MIFPKALGQNEITGQLKHLATGYLSLSERITLFSCQRWCTQHILAIYTTSDATAHRGISDLARFAVPSICLHSTTQTSCLMALTWFLSVLSMSVALCLPFTDVPNLNGLIDGTRSEDSYWWFRTVASCCPDPPQKSPDVTV